MRATLYEALGIPQNASEHEVRAALRGQIRKYYGKTRDGQGNVEEALRFINHASRILSDPQRRAEYDRQLAAAEGSTEQRIAHVVRNAVGDSGFENTDIGQASTPVEVDDILESGLDAEPVQEELLVQHHPGLTERVAAFERSSLVTLAVCGVFVAFIAAAIVFVTPEDAVVVGKQVLVWVTLVLLALSVVYGVVHGLAWNQRRRGLLQPAAVPQTELAILNWRREKSVFLGTNQPQEDASWIFQLRMAELERAKTGRTSEPRPWSRLGARVFDSAIWGLVLALLLSELRALDVIGEELAYWLAHPLLAPVLITATWIPIEAVLLASLQTTPGKWLFGCYLQFSISDAYAPRDPRSHMRRALRRAFRVWWQGLGCGFPLVAPVVVALAYERLVQQQEADWDAAQDCLVTHGPPGLLNTATGIGGVAAMLWLYGVAWHQPLADALGHVEQAVARSVPSTPEIVQEGRAGRDRLLLHLRDGLSAGAIAERPASLAAPAAANIGVGPGAAVDAVLDAELETRRARLAALKDEGPRMLRAGNYRRAADLCTAWADLDLHNAAAFRCAGEALLAQGNHSQALVALRKAKALDPADRSIDPVLDRAQNGIVADFLARYRK